MRGFGILLIAALALGSITAKLTSTTVERQSTIAGLLTETDLPAGFEYALNPRPFNFPADHASHPRFRSEWWYFTGNVVSENGMEFGFQLTLFRFALTPSQRESRSPWRRSNVYLGHFAISDINTGKFYHFERQGRTALNFAGGQADPTRIWLRDWTMRLIDPDKEIWRITAKEAGVRLDLVLGAIRPIIQQGHRGLSQKSASAGNASHYYSIPRLTAVGTITTPAGTHNVSGNAWYDHEWSTSALEKGQLGWDWFSLQLGDGSDLMFYRIRNSSGKADQASHGVLLSIDGKKTKLRPDEIQFTVHQHWRSPITGIRYPAAWEIQIPDQKLKLHIAPKLRHQEWD
ncbi:MAG: lipocalin-like domain-containing protein, partial [Gammaproteobacteria bacterium]